MRIDISVREGDFTRTTSPFGVRLAHLMSDSGAFDGAAPSACGSDRWDRLDRILRSTNFATVEVDASESLAGLTHAALRAAKSAIPVDPSAGPDTVLTKEQFRASATVTTRSWLADPATDEEYDVRATVGSVGLQDGDLVVLCIRHPPKAAYSLLPAPNTARLFSQLQLAAAADRPRRISGVLLYTDADVEMATFVRTHFDELNALSGELFQIFVHERPTDWRRAKQYWKPRTEPRLYQVLAALQWLKWVPYDKSGVYEVAQWLGVRPDDLPCLVLFHPLGDGERFVFPMKEASLSEYRRLFGELSETIHGALPPRVTLQRQLHRTRDWRRDEARRDAGLIPAGLAEAAERFRAAAIPQKGRSPAVYQFKGTTMFIHAGGDAVTENFNFHGQTTFINRPTDTVLTDFQNTYSAAPAGRELATLLQLVLTSEELDDEGRERVAALIHELAGDLDAAETDRVEVRDKLERIKTTVGQAADVAAPALGIVAKLLELLP